RAESREPRAESREPRAEKIERLTILVSMILSGFLEPQVVVRDPELRSYVAFQDDDLFHVLRYALFRVTRSETPEIRVSILFLL
ncbi:MAG: hypothetical protein ACTH6I_14970, partial [Vibrio litoralis]|uniref:hypothetical protein n=1 Tax=Vibrio litoralis TaxID=335972 RepID=UPI003F9DFA25